MAESEYPPEGYDFCQMVRSLLACQRCSALVCDAAVHDEFHDRVGQ